MQLKKIETDRAPKAIGPYSQALEAPPFLFLSGMLPIDPDAGGIVRTTIEGQTLQVLQNIEAVLKAAGVGFERVVKMEVFLKDLNDFQKMNEVYGRVFAGDVKPARHAFQVARLPLDALVEISCTAWCK